MFEIDTSRLTKAWADVVSKYPDILGAAAVEAIMSSESVWPVRTGASKAGFGYVVTDGRVQLVNDEDYADNVEERTGAAAETLGDSESLAVAALRDTVEDVF